MGLFYYETHTGVDTGGGGGHTYLNYSVTAVSVVVIFLVLTSIIIIIILNVAVVCYLQFHSRRRQSVHVVSVAGDQQQALPLVDSERSTIATTPSTSAEKNADPEEKRGAVVAVERYEPHGASWGVI